MSPRYPLKYKHNQVSTTFEITHRSNANSITLSIMKDCTWNVLTTSGTLSLEFTTFQVNHFQERLDKSSTIAQFFLCFLDISKSFNI